MRQNQFLLSLERDVEVKQQSLAGREEMGQADAEKVTR
jgi:hypothetical protein